MTVKPIARTPLISQLLVRLGERAGVVVELEPNFGRAGRIHLGDGRYSYLHNGALDLNPVGASDLATSKDWAGHFMATLGYPVVEGAPFYSDRFCAALGSDRNLVAAWRYANELGLPVVVKPNSRSQGRGVCLVESRRDFLRAARAVFRIDRVLLVQRLLVGRDHRLVVLDGECISAYERLPLTVVGDGVSTVSELIGERQRTFDQTGRDTEIDIEDMRISMHLARHGMSLDSIPVAGLAVTLFDNRNLSTGGDAIDVTDTIHAGYRDLAAAVSRDMGLRLCGVDLMVDGDITAPPLEGRHTIIEINAAPGLDHYAASGERQEAIVDALYLRVLEALRAQVPADAGRRFAAKEVSTLPLRSSRAGQETPA